MTRGRKQWTLEERALCLATELTCGEHKDKILRELRAAVRQEREACARECDYWAESGRASESGRSIARTCALDIRKRKT